MSNHNIIDRQNEYSGTEYESDIYYDVIIKNKTFMGWKAPDVGLGKMRFIHPEHGEFRVNKGLSTEWMKECWEDFIKYSKQFKD